MDLHARYELSRVQLKFHIGLTVKLTWRPFTSMSYLCVTSYVSKITCSPIWTPAPLGRKLSVLISMEIQLNGFVNKVILPRKSWFVSTLKRIWFSVGLIRGDSELFMWESMDINYVYIYVAVLHRFVNIYQDYTPCQLVRRHKCSCFELELNKYFATCNAL